MSQAAMHPKTPDELLRRVLYNLQARCQVPVGARALVGVSGGCDSVALLRALSELSSAHALQLTVAHFDHGLRADSADDAHFVVELAAQLGLEVSVGAWDRPETGEEAARRARHAFLLQAAGRSACEVIVLGHQLEDQVETVLMRLARGTGPRGLSGIAWRRPGTVDIVRPLLDCRRRILALYLRSLQQPWREDPSNRDATRTRNRVRHELLPVLEQTFGAGTLANWADSLEDMRTLWEFLSLSATALLAGSRRRSLLEERGRIELCDVAPLRGAPGAVCGAALQRWFEAVGCLNLRRQHVRAALHLVRNGRSGQQVGLPGGASVRLEQNSVVVVAPRVGAASRAAGRVSFETAKTSAAERGTHVDDPVARLFVETTRSVPDHERVVRDSVRVTSPDAMPTELVAWVDLEAATAQPWRVRTAQRGERVRLLGAPGSRKLARILQDSRIPHRLRDAWPIVADADGIIWVPGIGVAERVRVRPETTLAARLTLRTQSSDRPSSEVTRAAAAEGAPRQAVQPDAVPASPTPATTKPTPGPAARPTAWGG